MYVVDVDKWKCVGVAVESEAGSKDNVGFVIPLQVIRHFMEDIKKQMIDPSHPMGFPNAGMNFQRADKKNTRAMLGIPGLGQGLIVVNTRKG